MTGIQETKEVLVAVNELGLVIVKHIKDGPQIADVPAIITELTSSDSFKLALAKAVENIKQVPSELADVNLLEGLAITQLQVGYISKFVDAFKNK